MMNEELKNLEVAVMAHKEGRLHDAENMYRAILESNPLQADANHNLGLIACAVGKPELSLPLFEVALKAYPTHEQYLNSYIDALIAADEISKAKKIILLNFKFLKFDKIHQW